MQRLLQFLFRYRIPVFFIVLESLCTWIIIKNNNYQGSKFYNASNRVSASIAETVTNVASYFALRAENEVLAEENARLRGMLLKTMDSLQLESLLTDSSDLGIKAKVIDNSLFFRNNFILVNRGLTHGVTEGMGVIGPDGVVGQVQRVSDNFSTVISLLHGRSLISAEHGPTNTLSTVVWEGDDHMLANVLYIPRHVKVSIGDSIWTSGYNSVFPEQTLIGLVSDVHINPDATFYEIDIDLATDFGSLDYVYLMKSVDKQSIDTLRTFISIENE